MCKQSTAGKLLQHRQLNQDTHNETRITPNKNQENYKNTKKATEPQKEEEKENTQCTNLTTPPEKEIVCSGFGMVFDAEKQHGHNRSFIRQCCTLIKSPDSKGWETRLNHHDSQTLTSNHLSAPHSESTKKPILGRHDLDIDWHKDQASGQTQKLSPPTDRDPPIKTSLSRDVDPPKSHRPDSPSYQPTLPVYVSSDEYETESEEEEETKHEIPPSKRDKNRHHKTQSAMLKALKTQISLIEQSIKAQKRKGNSSSNPQANQLVMTKTKPVPITSAKPLNVSERGLAHLKVGLHASLPAEPTWHYALLDSGCTDNLISIKTIQALPDYEKITITGTESKNLRTANNDMSQQIHGKTTLNVSLISEDNERIVLSMPFYVVDGLIYAIFIGQPFLSSEDKISEDNDHIYVKNSNPNESSNDTKNDKKIHKIKKTYKKHKTTKTIQKHNIPANSSVRVQTNQLYPEANPDMFTYFTPSDAFHLNHPSLHIMNQTVLSPQNNRSVEIFIVNTEDREVLLPAHTKIGHIHTEFIDQAEVSPLHLTYQRTRERVLQK